MTDREKMRDVPVDAVVEDVGVARAIGIKHVASLLFTYRCTIACRHCLFHCSPRRPDVCVSVEDGVEFLRQLRQTDRVIHIAGGEAMMYYPQMLEICRRAHQDGAAPHFFETNASWCVDDDTTRRRYEELLDLGVRGVLISADPYHQAFVPPHRRLRAYQWAVEVYGRKNVLAGDYSLEQLMEFRRIGKDEARLGMYSREHAPRLVGRAGESLAPFYPVRDLDALVGDTLWHGGPAGRSCRSEFDPEEMWEIHIDPYGNIQTCCGIIVGNVRERPLLEWMRDGFHTRNELVRMAYEEGPYAYLRLAEERGYVAADGYPQKCGLCWEARKFLRPFFPETFGPAEVYNPI
jgi:hypothetical protein